MPVTLILTAIPAKFVCEDESDQKTLIIHPFGKKYGLTVYIVSNMQGIEDAVTRFAQQIHTQFPGHSFSVMVRVRSGDNPPKGFEQALKSGALGQHRFTTISEHDPRGTDNRT